ncbi:class I SAM-dependent methyltransferase [Panacibacter ginsenosidivorans]|uniref:Class I SAM-dependent methyltransferase n=1 Tax=Panacibacter ginsenosidivorans TaxID=1813871 RepID=A0A5B8VBZ5_9BACT|nr:class I SAM-dependent methyltransferase [Panacibacter ginsenosidivorans]QEC69030.1 class I SAM-dependent methyltransferase [Panacibacter ginsenosidivorans]
MKKLSKTLKAIAAIIKNPWLLNNVLADDAVWQQYIEKSYQIKNGLPVVDINEISPNFSETLDCVAFLDGSSLPTDFALLKSLTKRFKDCSYFEIGTWRGESAINVAENCKECYTLNLSKEEIISLGLGEKYADLHGFFSKGKENIKHITGNSLTYDFKSVHKKFDLIFIDGDHRNEYVKNDTQKIFEHLIHEKSIVVWHDYAYNPEKYRPEVLAGILDGIPVAFRKNLYHVSNTMCAIFIREQFPASVLQSPVTPDKTFKIKIESRSI